MILTSGGAFRDYETDELLRLCKEDPEFVRRRRRAPNWDMGAKITVDSATMMSKELEVIEAHYLFGAAYGDIDIVITRDHPLGDRDARLLDDRADGLARHAAADPLLHRVPHRVAMPPDNWEKPPTSSSWAR